MAQKQQQQGTRAVLRSWLETVKGMTYTKYSHMKTTDKLVIMKEYGARKVGAGLKRKSNESGQSDSAQEGIEVSVSKVKII